MKNVSRIASLRPPSLLFWHQSDMTDLLMINDVSLINADKVDSITKTDGIFRKNILSYNKATGFASSAAGCLHCHQELNLTQRHFFAELQDRGLKMVFPENVISLLLFIIVIIDIGNLFLSFSGLFWASTGVSKKFKMKKKTTTLK